jgi:hypothetical protein
MTITIDGTAGIYSGGGVFVANNALAGSPIAGDMEYNGTALYFTPAGSQRGVVPTKQFYMLTSGYTGNNATGAQSIFGLTNGVTLAANTTYAFQSSMFFAKTAGTTSHTLALSFGGTATYNTVDYTAIEQDNNGTVGSRSALGAVGGSSFSLINTSSATAVTAAMTATNQVIGVTTTGVISVNVGGTLLPQYTLSAAPGGAYTTQPGSYFLIYPVAAGSANVNVGTWS